MRVDSNQQISVKVDSATFDKAKVEAALKEAGYAESKVRG